MTEYFTENKDWHKNPNKTIGVTWDGKCHLCGFELLNKKFITGQVAIEGSGRKIAPTRITIKLYGEIFRGTDNRLTCSVCCPDILRESDC